MRIKKGIGPFALFSFFVSLVLCAFFYIVSDVEISPPIFIAHAGGAINQETYTNSLEALNSNYEKGFRFFEMDFSLTSDQELVSIHDWEDSFQDRFYVPNGLQFPTKAQFLHLKSQTGLTQLSLADVLKWVEGKGDACIVTDIKYENVETLKKIMTDFKRYQKYIVPQVYSYKEYEEVSNLGFENIILTIYRMQYDDLEEIMNFSKKYSPFAITMPWQIVKSGLAYYLKKNNIRVYAHTVNDINQFFSLRKMGVFGVYTDYLSPP